MRRRSVVASLCIVAAVPLGLIGRATGVAAFDLLSGLCFLAGIGLALSLLPFWRRVFPRVPALPGLFQRGPPGSRWSTSEGRPLPPAERQSAKRK